MQIPTAALGSPRLIVLGAFHHTALLEWTETAIYAEAFLVVQKALIVAAQSRQAAELALVGPRVAARFSEYRLEETLRGIAGAAHASDNNMTSGPAFNAVFARGLDVELRPRGSAQLAAARTLRDRLDKQPAAAGLKSSWLTKLDEAIADLATKLAKRAEAGQKVGTARADEDGAQEVWVSAYDSNAGAIRQLFPKNRRKQDLFFDDFRDKSVETEEAAHTEDPKK